MEKSKVIIQVVSKEKKGKQIDDIPSIEIDDEYLNIPKTPISDEDDVLPSPINYEREDDEEKKVEYSPTPESKKLSFSTITKKEEMENNENIENIETDLRLSDNIQVSLERSIPFLLELKRETHKCLQKALRAKLGKADKMKTLILDLDHTLIYAYYDDTFTLIEADKHISTKYLVPYVSRPYLHTFLHKMDLHYDLWVYTAGETDYAHDILSSIDPSHIYFRGALTRDNCSVLELLEGEIMGLKNLSVIDNRNIEDLIIVDDTIHAWPNNLSNLIPIPSFHGNPKDRVLKDIIPLLVKLSKSKDIRRSIQETIPLVKNCRRMMYQKKS